MNCLMVRFFARAGCGLPFLAAVVFVLVVGQLAEAQRVPPNRGMPDEMFGGPPPFGAPQNLEPEKADPDELPPKPSREYKEIRLSKADETGYMRQRSEIRRILMAGKLGGNQRVFDDFINKYFLGHWTLWENRTSLPSYRKELRGYFQQTKGGEVYDHLNTLVMEFANTVVRDNYNPAVQINALLAVGELNRAEPGSGETAAPVPQALAMLLEVVNDQQLPDALRAAAMVGVQRHAASGVGDANARRTLTNAMLKLATAEPPTGPTAMGRQWIVGQALDTLGLLGSPGEENAVFKAMIDVVADSGFTDRTRTIAADALGRLNYAGVAGVDPAVEAAKITRFLLDAVARQTRISTETTQPVSPRRIKQLINACLTALSGSGSAGQGIISLTNQAEKKALLDELHKTIKTLGDQLDKRGSQDMDIASHLEELRKGLEAWLQKQSGEAPKEGGA